MEKESNKFVEFINGHNSIMIKNKEDFNTMRELCKRIGISFFENAFWRKPPKPRVAEYEDFWELAFNNRAAIMPEQIIIVEYQPNHSALGFGYRSIKASVDWFGQEPYTVQEVLESLI